MAGDVFRQDAGVRVDWVEGVVMSSAWMCRILGTCASPWWSCSVHGKRGLELQELRNGDRQHVVISGALGGGEVTPTEWTFH